MIRCCVYLDKAAKQLVVKIVYIGGGQRALDEVSSIAAKPKAGTASPVTPRLGDSVRTFTQQMPALQVRGFALRIEIVGASLAALAANVAASELPATEKMILKADALIFVVDADESDAKATFERMSKDFYATASNAEHSPIALVGATTEKATLGASVAPMFSGPNAGVLALQAVTKQILANVLSGLEN